MVKKNKSSQPLVVTISDWAGEGQGVGRTAGGRVIFVPFSLPGETVEVLPVKTKRNFIEGQLLRVKHPSSERQNAPCRHFGDCGGCALQHAPYELQLKLKENHIYNLFKHLGKFPFPYPEAVVPSPKVFEYRNKLDFAFSAKRWLPKEDLQNPDNKKELACGFHVVGHFDKVLQVEECLLMPPLNNKIRQFITRKAIELNIPFFNTITQEGILRGLVLRCNLKNEWMVMLVVSENGESVAQNILASAEVYFPEVISWYYVVNNKKNDSLHDLEPILWKGAPWLIETIHGLKFRIHPKSFFQTNSRQAEKLYSLAQELAECTEESVLFDFYCGAGTTTAIVGQHCKLAIGVDIVPEAINDSIENARLNRLNHLKFIGGDILKVLQQDYLKAFGKPDVLLTDPPRSGMSPKVCQSIFHLLPPRIVYISCNASTMIRDINILSEKYEVCRIIPLDMFPQTRHTECVVSLIKKTDAFTNQ